MPTTRITAAEKRAISVEASVDPRTLNKALRGEKVSPMPLARIRTALAARGLTAVLLRTVPA